MAEKIPKRIRNILDETRRELEIKYSQRLKQMILFGSYARGDHSKDSVFIFQHKKYILSENA